MVRATTSAGLETHAALHSGDVTDAGAPRELIRVERVGKRFGNVVALEDVSMRVTAGRVTCVLGDNGAGKSTLIGILSGVHRPTSGRCWVDGEPVTFDSPRHALARGIATVHQDLALIPLMSVWRNFFLGSEPTRGGGPFRRLDVARCRDVTRSALRELGVPLHDVDRPVGTLSGGERQCIAVARAVHLGARVLILDEPTAALGVKQAGIALRMIARVRERGIGVVLITHNPQHAFAAGDRFIVLRHGRLVTDRAKSDITLDELAALMAGGAQELA